MTDPLTGQVQEYCHLVKGPNKAVWEQSFANELGRLAHGGEASSNIKGTGTLFSSPKKKFPLAAKSPTAASFLPSGPRRPKLIAPASPLVATTVLIIPVMSAHLLPNSRLQNVSSTAPSQPLMHALLFLTSATSTSAPQWSATNTCASH
jgi:hypothetical protein